MTIRLIPKIVSISVEDGGSDEKRRPRRLGGAVPGAWLHLSNIMNFKPKNSNFYNILFMIFVQ